MSLWNWFWNIWTLVYNYFLVKYKGFQFDRDAKYAIKETINRQTLFDILKCNKNTKFLIDRCRETNVDPQENIENFKKLFPKCTEYPDYASYVTEIKNDGNAKDIMGVGYPIALTNTSGTSGAPKNLPIYSLDINEAYAICHRLTQSVRSNLFNGCKAVTLNSLKYETYWTEDKLRSYPVSAITTIAAREKQNIETILKFNQTVVPAIILEEISQQNDLFIFISIWALQCVDLESISSTFVMAMIHFFTYMEEKFDFICKHIELGTIPADESLSIPISLDVRLALQSSRYHLPPNPSRANELREIVKQHGFHNANTHFWPKLKCGICIIGPSIRQFELKLLSTYWNSDVPIFPYVYGMSEHHRIAIPLKSNAYELIPQPRSIFYEFIEVENDDDDEEQKSPTQAFELHQIEEGKRYEVVLTTYDGLYRYKTQDIIRVTGRYYALPIWQLIGRRGQYLSVASEHVTEIELREIINSILSAYEQEFTSSSPQYSVFTEKSSYILSMEVDDDKQEKKERLKAIGKEICSKFDQKLQESNDDYRKFREKKKISAPKFFWLKNNTLTTGTRNYRLDPNKSGSERSKAQLSNQLKSQLIMKAKDKDVIKFLKENLLLKID